MSILQRCQKGSAAVIAACFLAACGGGGGSVSNTTPAPAEPVAPGSPAVTGNVATDGVNWINFRRSQAGLSVLARTALIDSATFNHSEYQRANNTVAHDEIAGRPGFTGVTPLERLQHVGYFFTGGYAYGEVISGATSSSGQFLAEELITAIFHRFVIFEPKFKEVGGGSAVNGSGYTYFTTNFTANNGFGTGLGAGQLVSWPVNGQTGVTRDFRSDFESPDPVPGIDLVGYPVSVHGDINVTLNVTSFTIKPRGGANMNVQLLAANNPGDVHTPSSAAAIVPLTVLAASTTYDVSFSGTSNGTAISKTWSFTTKP
ncbi:MAG: CAP domain-containing protein [Pseudomonadota bacterium]